jgi:hypothetical protein
MIENSQEKKQDVNEYEIIVFKIIPLDLDYPEPYEISPHSLLLNLLAGQIQCGLVITRPLEDL